MILLPWLNSKTITPLPQSQHLPIISTMSVFAMISAINLLAVGVSKLWQLNRHRQELVQFWPVLILQLMPISMSFQIIMVVDSK
jgi:hypothetical protein